MFRNITVLIISVVIIISACGAYADESLSGTLFDQIAAGQVETADAAITAESHLLRSDNLITSMKNGVFCIFGSDIDRSEIESIHFINNIEEVAEDSWDVSASGDGSVLAWVVNNTLYIGSEGGVKAPADCTYMFSLYRNLRSVDFNTYFDTSETTDMTGMFASCESLREIDLNTLDVSNVTSMESMFEACDRLQSIHAADWNLASLRNSNNIFNGCKKLGFNTIDGIWAEKYEALEAIAAETWKPLKLDMRGDSVMKLQERLMELGYNSITKADGIFGARTGKAVHAFKADHNIYDGKNHAAENCVASGLMQEALYAEDVTPAGAEPKLEEEQVTTPDTISLTIPEKGKIRSKNLSNNQVKLTFDITNDSSTHTVVAYTLSVYTSSVWGAELYDAPITFTFDATIEPGSTIESGDVIVDERGQVANLYVGVQSVTYDDGTTVTTDNISYSHFTAVQWL